MPEKDKRSAVKAMGHLGAICLALRHISRAEALVLTKYAKAFWDEASPLGDNSGEIGKHFFALIATVTQELVYETPDPETDFLAKGE